MDVDGKWQVDMQSPMGKQSLFFEFKSNGAELVGALTGTEESHPDIIDGAISGREISYKLRVAKPMPIKLKFTATIEGDKLNGKVKPGMFPAFPIVGHRL